MAGHFPLNSHEEPKVFALAEDIKHKIVKQGRELKDFTKFVVRTPGKHFKAMKLSLDYVENPEKEIAFNVGKFSLVSFEDEHKSLTQNISLEIHFDISGKAPRIKNIYWVA